MRKVAAGWIAILLVTSTAAWGGPERAWIVLDMEMPNGQPAQMAFNNPNLPDMTLAECKSSLNAAMPSLKAAVDAEPRLRGNRIKSANCVMSVDDPIKPKS
jgi:hypothetical protein